MHTFLRIAVLLATCSPFAGAVQAAPAGPSPDATVLKMLHSHDPKQIAWAAAYVAEHPDDATTTALAALAEDWEPADFRDTDPKVKANGLAMLAVLDTLIQTHTPVSAGGIAALDSVFPAQAAVLASRLPQGDRETLLMNWFSRDPEPVPLELVPDGSVTETPSMETTVSGLLLAHEPPPGFAAGVVREAREDIRIILTSGDVPPRIGQGSSCDWGAPELPQKGWPVLYTYAVRRFSSASESGGLLAEGGGLRLYYARVETPDGLARTGCPPPMSMATFRHVLIATMLGIDARAMRRTYWMPQRWLFVGWQSADQYMQQVQKVVQDTEARMSASVQALEAAHALSPEQAAQVRPKLVLTIHDNRGPDQPPLPDLVFTDPRTTAVIAPPAQPAQ